MMGLDSFADDDDDDTANTVESETGENVSPLILDDDDFFDLNFESPPASKAVPPPVAASGTDDKPGRKTSVEQDHLKPTGEDLNGKLCPRCMRYVSEFRRGGSGADIQYFCSICDEAVQFRYVEDYDHVSRVKMSLGGMSGHGKTMFLRGIYSYLNSLGRKWHGFRFLPLSDDDAQAFRIAVGDNADGRLADPSVSARVKTGHLFAGQNRPGFWWKVV